MNTSVTSDLVQTFQVVLEKEVEQKQKNNNNYYYYYYYYYCCCCCYCCYYYYCCCYYYYYYCCCCYCYYYCCCCCCYYYYYYYYSNNYKSNFTECLKGWFGEELFRAYIYICHTSYTNAYWHRMLPLSNKFTSVVTGKKRWSYPCNRPWRPIGFWDVEAPTFSSDNQLTVVMLSTLCAGRPLPPGRFPVLISVTGWVDLRTIVRLEGLGKR
jgi:hypothetical protein